MFSHTLLFVICFRTLYTYGYLIYIRIWSITVCHVFLYLKRYWVHIKYDAFILICKYTQYLYIYIYIYISTYTYKCVYPNSLSISIVQCVTLQLQLQLLLPSVWITVEEKNFGICQKIGICEKIGISKKNWNLYLDFSLIGPVSTQFTN